MAIVAKERPQGRQENLKQGKREFIIKESTGADFTSNEALAAMILEAPTTIGSLNIVLSDCDVEEIGKNIYYGTVPYTGPGDTSKQHVGDFNIQFDISGQNQKINYSYSTISSYVRSGLGGLIRNFKGAINVNSDGTVEGTDIIIPTAMLSVNYTVDPADMTEDYFRLLTTMVGKVNSDSFKGFSAGELLLSRVSGSQRDGDNWDLGLSWGVSENATGLTIGGTAITGIDKDGWDYLWVYFTTEDDVTNHVTNKVPQNAFVERVYKRAAYSSLGLP